MSPSSHILLGSLVCLALLGFSVGLTGNCSQVEPFYIFQETVGFQIHPLRLEAFPAYEGRRAAAIGVLWEPKVAMERNRTFYEIGGKPLDEPECSYPVGLLNDPFNEDPDKACNTRESIACGAILQSIYFTEFDCVSQNTSDIFQGVSRQTYSIVYTHQLHPDLRITFDSYLVNDSVLYYPLDDPTNPDAIKWDFHVGRLKFGYEFIGFPWLEPNATVTLGSKNNGTFLYGAYATSLTVSQGIVEVNQTEHSLIARFTSTNGTLGLELGVDTGAIVDGIGFNDAAAVSSKVYNFTAAAMGVGDDPNLMYNFGNAWSNLHICEPTVGQWKNATFDPYLTALFTPEPSPNQSKSDKKVVIASAVTVSVVVVLLASFVILVCTVPALKNRVLPNSQKLPTKQGAAGKNALDVQPSSRATAQRGQAVATPVVADAPTPSPTPAATPAVAEPAPAPARAAAWSTGARPSNVVEAEAPTSEAGWNRSSRPTN